MEVDGTPNGYSSESAEEPEIRQEPLKKHVSANGCFDCNICLDFAVDPVVTLCGHLYCWPCIYKWLEMESVPTHQCPVCKASLAKDSLVPLYGRGHSTESSHQSFNIPQRPSSSVHHRGQSEIESESDDHPIPVHRHYHVHQHEHYHHYPYHGPSSDFMSAPSSPSLGAMNRGIHSMAGEVLRSAPLGVWGPAGGRERTLLRTEPILCWQQWRHPEAEEAGDGG